MLDQYEARHNHQQASVQLMASTRHTHDKPQQAVLFVYCYDVLTEAFSFFEAYLHIILHREYFVRNSFELK